MTTEATRTNAAGTHSGARMVAFDGATFDALVAANGA